MRSEILLGVVLLLAAGLPARAQQIVVTPDDQTAFTFSGFEGGPFLPQTLTTWKLDNADPAAADFTVISSQLWLKVAPGDGTVGGLFTRNIDVVAKLDAAEAASLAPGQYTATVSFNNLTNGSGNTTRTVRLNVAPANFSVTPSFIDATGTLNGANPSDVVVTLRGNGQPVLNYDLSWVARSWFSVDRRGGTVLGSGTDSFKVSFNIDGLDAGTYTGQIDVTNTTNGAGSRQIPISLTVKSKGAGVVSLLPDQDIEVIGPVGDLPAVTQRSTVVNDGETSVIWSAVSDSPWVSVSPSAGEIAGSAGASAGLNVQGVDIRVNAAAQALPAGTSTATVTFQTITTNPITGTTASVAFGTRVVHVVADPVLAISLPAVGGKVTTDPPGTATEPATSTSKHLSFAFGEVVVVTATPADGYEFREWAGDFPKDAQTTNPIILPMDASKNLGALIAPILRQLSLSTVGGGSGTIDMAPTGMQIENALTAKYNNGTSVKLTAAADAGSVFRGWSGNVPPGDELSNPLTVKMDRDRVISARFESSIKLDIKVTGGGKVAVNPDLPAYAAGMIVILTATPDDTFAFTGWSGGASGSDNPLTLTLVADMTITATFASSSDSGGGGSGGGGSGGGGSGGGDANTAKLVVEIQGDGVVTPASGTYAKGATVTIIATPGLNSTFVRWEQDAAGSALVTTLVMDRDRTVRAIFEPVTNSSGRTNPSTSGSGTLPTCGALGFLGLPMLLLGWMSLASWSRRR